MKFKSIIAAASTVLLASTATLSFAGGDHAGGHGDSDAIGKQGKAANAKRTISVDMTDAMRFTPDNVMVKQGEAI